MRRFLAITLVYIMLAVILTGCSQYSTGSDGNISVVCTSFPQYDWTRQILGDKTDNFELVLLMNNWTDLHNYQPTVDDIIKISTCDLFIYVGGESDKWVDDALKGATNKKMVIINLLDVLGHSVKMEEITEGMEGEHRDEHGSDETEYDEHVWLSLKNAQVFCAVIENTLASLDVDHAGEYMSNLNEYTDRLSALDAEYRTTVDAAPINTLLFGDRFPFRYLLDDYGLDYHAAFAGCSTETEAGFDTIIFLTKKVNELSLNNIIVTENSDKKIAETIIRESTSKNQQILVLNAMQSLTVNDVQNGITYLSIMESNLNVLKAALQ